MFDNITTSVRLLRAAFAILLALMIAPMVMILVGIPENICRSLAPFALTAAMVFLVLHGKRSVGLKRAGCVMFIGGFTGFWAEFVSLRHHTLFGGSYSYPPDMWPGGFVADVPILVVLFWSVFFYLGYSVSNAFVAWAGGSLPNRATGRWPWLAVFAVMDGLLVVSLDLVLDPVLTVRGNWVWTERGSFFGVPPGNFAGWFCVVIISSLLARGIEYLRRPVALARGTPAVMPVVVYATLAAGLVFEALWIGI